MLSHGQVQENLTMAVSLSPNFTVAPLLTQGCSCGKLGRLFLPSNTQHLGTNGKVIFSELAFQHIGLGGK